MQLTYYTDYALRLLLYAAAHHERRITMREVATAYGISLEHLRKIVHQLAQNGYLITSQGRNGGAGGLRYMTRLRMAEETCSTAMTTTRITIMIVRA
ncbi:Rrf2 family transcriptional regulator [Halorhodospira halochloris]|uniref:Rrf2 family transcriptional regulator n=1 Tax=Halorhodospira halochloris TaxID=1052 RepID=UPI003B75C91E